MNISNLSKSNINCLFYVSNQSLSGKSLSLYFIVKINVDLTGNIYFQVQLCLTAIV